MATILNDVELRKLIGTVIRDGDPDSIRPNSYILRLGGEGEFLNAGKTFALGKSKKGIRISPGHSVAVTAFETIDFSSATVDKIYPGCALHALISPTTDLSREGIVAPTTQVDAGYNGTPIWTNANAARQASSGSFPCCPLSGPDKRTSATSPAAPSNPSLDFSWLLVNPEMFRQRIRIARPEQPLPPRHVSEDWHSSELWARSFCRRPR